jgi:holin-like protein
MPVMFIPAGVELMVSWGVLKPMLLPVSVITVVSLLTVFAVTGRVAQFTIRHQREEK